MFIWKMFNKKSLNDENFCVKLKRCFVEWGQKAHEKLE